MICHLVLYFKAHISPYLASATTAIQEHAFSIRTVSRWSPVIHSQVSRSTYSDVQMKLLNPLEMNHWKYLPSIVELSRSQLSELSGTPSFPSSSWNIWKCIYFKSHNFLLLLMILKLLIFLTNNGNTIITTSFVLLLCSLKGIKLKDYSFRGGENNLVLRTMYTSKK